MPTPKEIAEAVWEFDVPAGYVTAPKVQAQTAAKAATITEVATRGLPAALADLKAEQARQSGLLGEILAKLNAPAPGGE